MSANTTTGGHPALTPAGGTALRTRKGKLDQHPTWKHLLGWGGGAVLAAAALAAWLLEQNRAGADDAVKPVKATVRQLDLRLQQEHADHLQESWQMRQELRDVNNDVRAIAGKPQLPPVAPPPAAAAPTPEMDP